MIHIYDVADGSYARANRSGKPLVGFTDAMIEVMNGANVDERLTSTDAAKLERLLANAQLLPDGEVLSLRHCVSEADGETRWLSRRVTPFERDFKGNLKWQKQISQPFACERLKNGNTLIAGGNNNRVLEVDKGGKVVWSIGHDELPGIRLAWVTTLQVLPSGNIIVGNCHAGKGNPQLCEITSARGGGRMPFWVHGKIRDSSAVSAPAEPLYSEAAAEATAR